MRRQLQQIRWMMVELINNQELMIKFKRHLWISQGMLTWVKMMDHLYKSKLWKNYLNKIMVESIQISKSTMISWEEANHQWTKAMAKKIWMDL
jgi:hypothetical protein